LRWQRRILVAQAIGLAQVGRQLLVVVAQLGKHVQGRNEISVVIQKTLQTADVTDRTQRRPCTSMAAGGRYGDPGAARRHRRQDGIVEMAAAETPMVRDVGAAALAADIARERETLPIVQDLIAGARKNGTLINPKPEEVDG
jgi:hypothetical protein